MIRKYETGDLETVMAIWLETNCLAHPFVARSYWTGHFEEVKTQLPQAEVYVYEADGEVVGFIGLMDTYIAGIFVRETHWGKGVGRALLETAKAQVDTLTLSVYKANEKAYRFYLKAAFQTVAERPDLEAGAVAVEMVWKKEPPRAKACVSS
ncbi:GNAT family N-acetyltransferase [Fusibacter sp. JL298sf-3]